MFLLTEDKPLLRKKIIGLGYDQEHDLITILVIKKEILKNKIKSYGIKITADLYTNKEKKKKTPKIGSHYFCLPEVALDSGYI